MKTSETETLKLDELAHAAGTSARTVRYYVQRGLLPAAAFKGKDTAYTREHLVRLQAIRKMQDAFFPLDAIATELERRPLDEIERIADGTLSISPATLTATDSTSSEAEPIAVKAHHGWISKRERAYRRVEIAEGVELMIADDAPDESRALAEKILREIV